MLVVITIGSAIALFACLLLLSKRPLATPHVIAAMFLLSLALPMVEKLIILGQIPLPYLPVSLLSVAPLVFGPFLYLYTRSILVPTSLRLWPSLLHFAPFFIITIIACFLTQAAPSEHPANPGPLPIFLSIVIGLSLVAYTITIFMILHRHRKSIPDYFSNKSLAVNLSWLNWITASFLLLYLLVYSGALGRSFEMDIGTTIFIVVFSFATLKQTPVFPAGPPEALGQKYEKSGLRETEAATLLSKLQTHMEVERPWLDPDLSIEELASTLGVPRHHLTQVINELLQKNFFRFVNAYRIQEVTRRIDQGAAEQLSLLGLALDCGFNSKSAFNLAFKNVQGCTPSEYRKKSVLP